MNKNTFLLFCLSILFIFQGFTQNSFRILGDTNKETVHFKLINNLMIIPVSLNGKKLNFLLDTGSRHSILFNVTTFDSLKKNEAKKIRIRGIGVDKYYDALLSNSNLLRIKNIVCPDFKLLIILNEKFEFSNRLGVNVDGILGSDFFKKFIIEVNYNKKRLKVSNPEKYTYKKCRKCTDLLLELHNQKPYISSIINTKDTIINVKLLIDSGSSDALWLHEDQNKKIVIPKKNIEGFLGKGLNGVIFGKKAKLKGLNLGHFKFKDVLVSYPNSIAFGKGKKPFDRNGLIGAEILSRFSIIYDYPNKKMRLKKNRHTFKRPFYYDKSGLDIIYNGKALVQKEVSFLYFNENNKSSIRINTYDFSFKNTYIIDNIKTNSIAFKVGLLQSDELIKINSDYVYDLSLQEINNILSGKHGKIIKLLVYRNDKALKYQFKLEDLL